MAEVVTLEAKIFAPQALKASTSREQYIKRH